MRKFLKNKEGFALILTMLVISLIVAVTLQFNTNMRDDLYAAANLKDDVKLDSAARSGFNYALAVLFEDGYTTDLETLRESWADSEIHSANGASMFEDERFSVSILDHSGRIQINQLIDQNGNFKAQQKTILERLLSSDRFDLEPEEVSDILEAIKDWLDRDNEVTGFGGAEESYYRTLEKPYSCRNDIPPSLEELLLIKGITRELFYGTKETPGIFNYLTVQGNGKVNINTADPMVLQALSEQLDEEMAEAMVVYREDEGNDLKDPKWYKNVPGMADVNLGGLGTVTSTYFEIISKSFKENMSAKITSMVERDNKGTLKILSFKIE